MLGNIMNAVKTNLISGGAYTQIAKALVVTFVITVLAWIIALLIGAVLSYFMCCRHRIITGLSAAVGFLFRSTPVLLILLLLYYVIFGSGHMQAMLIAAIALGVYGAGHFAELIMKAVRESAEWKDEEIRYRLKKAFFSAALPHAALNTLFPLKRLAIQLLQWSTVAGYIGVNELTEVMQQIGQRTMYPFFSIAFSALLYLIATILIEAVFAFLEKKFHREETDLMEEDET